MNDIFIVTSVIKTSTHPWSYTQTRSAYTLEERYEQTLHTISSIRTFHPSAKILMIECSDISDEMNNELKNLVDFYEQIYNTNEHIRTICHSSDRKGYGEVVQTLYGVRYLQSNNILFNHLFKLCGRYYLTEHFNIDQISNDAYTFSTGWDNGCHSTVLYSVPNSLLHNYQTVLEECERLYSQRIQHYERVLPERCHPKHIVNEIGSGGFIAVERNALTRA